MCGRDFGYCKPELVPACNGDRRRRCPSTERLSVVIEIVFSVGVVRL
jgi:hypothetical protein